MKLLHYNVAWIDDQPADSHGAFDRINNRLGRHGLELRSEWISEKSKLDGFISGLSHSSPVDLILVDWKLGQMEAAGGVSVACKIRNHNSVAPVIFYSAESAHVLRTQIAAQKIDGVFCVSRGENFVHEVLNVMRANLRKIFDITAMRGLFLGGVAEIDEIIHTATMKAFYKLPDEQKKEICEALIASAVSYFSDCLEKAKSVDPNAGLRNVADQLNSGSKQLLDCLIGVLSQATPSTGHAIAIERLQSLESEILVPRNDMAHVKEKEKDGLAFIERKGRRYDESNFDSLRVRLKDHYDNLEYINAELIDQLIQHLVQRGSQ